MAEFFLLIDFIENVGYHQEIVLNSALALRKNPITSLVRVARTKANDY